MTNCGRWAGYVVAPPCSAFLRTTNSSLRSKISTFSAVASTMTRSSEKLRSIIPMGWTCRRTEVVLLGRSMNRDRLESSDTENPGAHWRERDKLQAENHGAIFRFSPNGRKVVVCFLGGTSSVWNTETHHPVCSLNSVVATYASRSLVVGRNTNSSVLPSCHPSVLCGLRKRDSSVSTPHAPPGAINFAKRGRMLLAIDDTESPRVWNTRTGEEIDRLPKGQCTVLGPVDHRRLLVSAYRRYSLYDCESGRLADLAALRMIDDVAYGDFVGSYDGSRLVCRKIQRASISWQAFADPGTSDGNPSQVVSSFPPGSMDILAIFPDGENILAVSSNLRAAGTPPSTCG